MILRFIYGILFVMLILATGCKNEEKALYRIGFSQCTGDDEWRKAMLKEMQRELLFHPGAQLLYKDAHGNTQTQIKQIKELLLTQIDLLIVSPNEAQPITPIVNEAYQKGIPVVILDRRTASPFYTAYVGADNYTVGKTAAQYIGALLKGQGKIIEIKGLAQSSPAIDRHRGFTETIRAYPHIEVIASIHGNWEKAIAKKSLSRISEKLPQANLVFAHNDVMALGAYEVYQSDSLLNQVRFVGVDALMGPMGGIEMVQSKVLHATVLYPTGGEEAIRTAMQILQKQTFNRENILNTDVIDTSNVRMIKLQMDKLFTQQEDIERQQRKINTQIGIYQSQRNLLIVVTVTLIISVVLGAVALFSLKENKKINRALEEKNQEVSEQRNQIQEMAEKAKEATETKFRFFTNISHEFRTPLTLILGPIEDLLQAKSGFSTSQKKDLLLVKKNSYRLLRLVNQLMDYRKMENSKIQVKATPNDLVAFLREMMQPFEPLARKRGLDFRLCTSLTSLPMWFDPDMMDKVFFNLLSNAFKFTKKRGRIYVHIEGDTINGRARVMVEDTGVGMSEKDAQRAFEMFYQGHNASSKGTGLGLPLSKEFVSLHQGRISVSSQLGQGSKFLVELPLGKEHFAPEEIGEQKVESAWSEPAMVGAEEYEEAETPESNEALPLILLIEDNEELSQFVRHKLQASFRVHASSDGAQGLMEAIDTVPDLIICDVMLPGMDGLQVTSTLKADMRTSHIPVILLTAKNELDQQLKGLQTGADLYLTKPFSPQFLLESARNLLTNREILRNRYKDEWTMHPPSVPVGQTVSKLDKKFVLEFQAKIESKLSDASLSVDWLSKEIGVSRVQLYRKVKALMGCGVNDYIGSVRLNKACHLLQHTEIPIADIAYQVGFSSPAYFSATFKAKFGISPTDYRHQVAV